MCHQYNYLSYFCSGRVFQLNFVSSLSLSSFIVVVCMLVWFQIITHPTFKQYCLINFTVYLHPYSLQHTPLQLLDKKHFAKLSRQPIQNWMAVASQNNENLKQVALMEAKIEKLCDLLDEVSFLRMIKMSF